jgi:PIN domain nuclease of toxin-antitoxin system
VNGYLLDSHVWLWALCRPHFLSPNSRELLGNPRRSVFVRVATPWELLIKHAKRPLSEAASIFDAGVSGIQLALDAANISVLGISLEDAALAPRLPLQQADPFDRMIVAQAQLRRLAVITSDRAMMRYPKVDFIAS